MQAVHPLNTHINTQKSEDKKPLPHLAKRVFESSEHIWSYLGKLVILTRHALNITVKTCQRAALCCSLNRRILTAVTRLKLFSIVGVPFSIFSVHSAAQKLFKSFDLRDKEGVLLGSLTIALIATDIVDSLATFINAALAALSKAPVALLSTLGMPIAFALIGMGSASRTIQLIKTYSVFKEFQKAEKGQGLEQFLKAQLGSWELQMLKEKKRAALLRAAPAEVVKEFERIEELLKDQRKLTEKELAALGKSLDKISQLLTKKMIVDAANLMANILSFIGLTLFFFTVPPVTPFIFLAASMVLKISTLAFQDLT